MKFKYLGTAAAEGFPAVFCNCEYCNAARRKGGKNIRTRSQAIIDDDLLIDFPSDTYAHALYNGLNLGKIKHLLVTHSHMDHFVPQEFELRGICFAHDMPEKEITIYCNDTVKDLFFHINAGKINQNVLSGIRFFTALPFVPFQAGAYTVTPLPARHTQDEQSLIYIIEKDGKTVLYGNDTGYFYEEVFAYIEKHDIRFDMISLDCTMVNNPVPDTGTHMGFDQIRRVAQRLQKAGAVTDKTVKYVTHFSHNGNPLQSELEKSAKGLDFCVAYDGEEILL